METATGNFGKGVYNAGDAQAQGNAKPRSKYKMIPMGGEYLSGEVKRLAEILDDFNLSERVVRAAAFIANQIGSRDGVAMVVTVKNDRAKLPMKEIWFGGKRYVAHRHNIRSEALLAEEMEIYEQKVAKGA